MKVPRGFNDLVSERAQAAALLVRHAVVPLFAADESREPDFEATGTLIRLGQRRFVVSAAHVFDRLRGGVHMLIEGRERRALEKPFYSSIAGSSHARLRDMLDVGFCELTVDEAAGLSKQTFVDVADAGTVPDQHWAHRCLFVGYQANSQTRVPESSEYRSEQTYFSTPEISSPMYERSKLNRTQHVGVAFDHRNIAGPKGKGGNPMFQGMSGCGVWLLNPYETPTAGEQLTLLGFLAGPAPVNGKVMFGPRTSIVRDLIVEADAHEAERVNPTAV